MNAGTLYAVSTNVMMFSAEAGEPWLHTSRAEMVSPPAVDTAQMFVHGTARANAKSTKMPRALFIFTMYQSGACGVNLCLSFRARGGNAVVV